MRTKIVSLLAVAFSLGVVQAASAADMPTKAPMVKAPIVAPINWTGFYIGINAGGGWGSSNQTNSVGITSGAYNQSGGLVGGTLGANWQTSNFVVGLEGDFDWANIDGSATVGVCVASCYTNLRWFSTIRPRLGIAWGEWLAFITGGGAFGSVNAGCCALAGPASTTSTRSGWTIGGGVEMMFAPKWSAKVEYLYAKLADTTYSPALIVVPEKVSVVRGGINYHF